MGLKGRFEEEKLSDDHRLGESEYPMLEPVGDKLVERHKSALLTLNERLRDDYIKDCQSGVDRWNKTLDKLGVEQKLTLPHKGFHRKIGVFSESHISPDGRVLSEADWTRHSVDWLPSKGDHEHVESLMKRVVEPGRFASYIAPPLRGINNQSGDYEYVKFSRD
jgi:benzoyl-CoA 2,3-dioxygenase component B